MEVIRYCTCNRHHDHIHSGFCSSCGSSYRRGTINTSMRDAASSSSSPSGSQNTTSGEINGRFEHHGGSSSSFMYCYLPKLILALISGALTGFFALAGAFTGAVTGALAGRASDSGVLRGAGLGAVAGAVLCVEVLEASRAYWCSERSSSRSSPSMADFIEELLRGRLVREQLVPTVFTDYHWHVISSCIKLYIVSIGNIRYEGMYAAYDEVVSRGLSRESLKKLPHHVITGENKEGLGGSTCCAICLQDFEVGEIVRSLRRCHHMFHLTCVDKWLVRRSSCPVCRENV